MVKSSETFVLYGGLFYRRQYRSSSIFLVDAFMVLALWPYFVPLSLLFSYPWGPHVRTNCSPETAVPCKSEPHHYSFRHEADGHIFDNGASHSSP